VPPKPYKLFISHASEDTWVARQIERHAKEAGAETFLDRSDIATGDHFRTVIKATAKSSDELLVLFTPGVLKYSKFVWMEAGIFFGDDKRIIWVLYGVTRKQLDKDKWAADIIQESDMIGINDLDRYFEQLQRRVADARKVDA
jgi:hypothetical protein